MTVNQDYHSNKSVSGLAIIYSLGGESYILRLESLNAPTDLGLQVEITAGGQTVHRSTLRSPAGNQNYPFTASGSSVWTKVSILNPRVTTPARAEYGIALLQPAH